MYNFHHKLRSVLPNNTYSYGRLQIISWIRKSKIDRFQAEIVSREIAVGRLMGLPHGRPNQWVIDTLPEETMVPWINRDLRVIMKSMAALKLISHALNEPKNDTLRFMLCAMQRRKQQDINLSTYYIIKIMVHFFLFVSYDIFMWHIKKWTNVAYSNTIKSISFLINRDAMFYTNMLINGQPETAGAYLAFCLDLLYSCIWAK